MCRSIISLSKIAHEMCRDHPFSYRNKTTENAVGLGVEGIREKEGGRGEGGGGQTKFKKGEVGNISAGGGGGLQKIRGFGSLYQL